MIANFAKYITHQNKEKSIKNGETTYVYVQDTETYHIMSLNNELQFTMFFKNEKITYKYADFDLIFEYKKKKENLAIEVKQNYNINDMILEKIDNDFGWVMFGSVKVIVMLENGYFNATKLCKLCGKEFKYWCRGDNKNYVEYIEKQLNFGSSDQRSLKKAKIVIKQGGNQLITGTYVHPKLLDRIIPWTNITKKQKQDFGYLYIIFPGFYKDGIEIVKIGITKKHINDISDYIFKRYRTAYGNIKNKYKYVFSEDVCKLEKHVHKIYALYKIEDSELFKYHGEFKKWTSEFFDTSNNLAEQYTIKFKKEIVALKEENEKKDDKISILENKLDTVINQNNILIQKNDELLYQTKSINNKLDHVKQEYVMPSEKPGDLNIFKLFVNYQGTPVIIGDSKPFKYTVIRCMIKSYPACRKRHLDKYPQAKDIYELIDPYANNLWNRVKTECKLDASYASFNLPENYNENRLISDIRSNAELRFQF